MIPYGRQHITEDDIKAVVDVLRSDFLTQGPKVAEFEVAFAKYVGAEYAIAVANGTDALHLCTLSLGVEKGSKVITSPITFVATANSVLYSGGDVVFADIDPQTFCLDPNHVEDLLKKNPSTYQGLMPVDFAGYPADLESFRFLANKYGLWIIEDACHAPGASFKDKSGVVHRAGSGSLAELAIFSFHPVKHIACGEGGMITTNSLELANKIRLLRTHGITKNPAEMGQVDGGWYYEMQELGYNYRMPDMLCALGLSQLSRAESSLQRRQDIAVKYRHAFSGLPLGMQQQQEGTVNAHHLFVVTTKKRKELYDFLKTKDIYCQVHYIPVHQQPFYLKRYGKQSLPHAEKFYDECLSLPMYPSMTDAQQEHVISSVKSFFASHS